MPALHSWSCATLASMDRQLLPVAYASHSLWRQKETIALQTLAVVWAIIHFHSYLYGHSITVYADYLTLKDILETPKSSSEHAKWWTKVDGSGVKEVRINCRPGKLNGSADATLVEPTVLPLHLNTLELKKFKLQVSTLMRRRLTLTFR